MGSLGITPDQIEQFKQQMQQLQEENTKLKIEKLTKERELVIDAYNAETQRIRALSDHEVDGNQMEMNAIQMILDSSTKLDEHDMRRDEFDRNEGQDRSKQMMNSMEAQASRDHAIELATARTSSMSGGNTPRSRSSGAPSQP